MKIDRRGFLVSIVFGIGVSEKPIVGGRHLFNRPETSEPLEIEWRIAGPRGNRSTPPPTTLITASLLPTPSTFKPMGQPLETQICVFVDPAKTFQTILGIGGALTDSSAETFAKLPTAKQQEILNAYFDVNNGIGYTLARTNIHSCDFSSGSYTYVNEGDKELKSFSVNHDKQFRIPFIKQAHGRGRRETHPLWQPLESAGFHEGQQQYASWWKIEAGVLSILGQLLTRSSSRHTRKKAYPSGALQFKTSPWRRKDGSRVFTQRRKSETF